NNDFRMDSISVTNAKFCFDIFNKLKAHHVNENILYCPMSILTALAMVYLGARGNTESQMKKVLHFDGITGAGSPTDSQCGSSEYIHNLFKELLSEITRPNATYSLEIADKLYVDKTFSVLPEYLDCARKFYTGGVEEVNFKTAAEEARQLINSWVEKETNGQIKDLLVSSSIDSGTTMVFINTIYFKGIWKTAFNTEDTREMPFSVTKQESKPVQMMCLNNTFNVVTLPEEKMKILELSYDSGDLSMLVLLPDEVSGLERIEKTINFDKLREWTSTNAIEKKSMNVYLPRMKIEEKYNLTSILMALGMTDLFSRSANLTGISSVDNLMISDAVHGVFMEVNEEGTEAAGSTGAIGNIKHSLEFEEFRADHPFLFLIRYNPTYSILFFGRYWSP
ncbi:hypothetical protein CIB84_007456, partial [Bambusicola thoracicus]